MRGREGVVDPDVAELGELSDERRIVLFFLLVEAGVLQTKNVAVLHRGDGFGGGLADAVLGKGDRLLDHLRQRRRDGLQRILRIAALGAAEMRQQDHLAALGGNFGDGGRDAFEAGSVGDAAVFRGDVEVDAQQNALALDVDVIEGAEWFCHRRSRPGRILRDASLCSAPPEEEVVRCIRVRSALALRATLNPRPDLLAQIDLSLWER